MGDVTQSAWAKDMVISASGLNQAEKRALAENVVSAGGRYEASFSRRCTHLVVLDSRPPIPSAKVSQAIRNLRRWNITIVPYSWLQTAVKTDSELAPKASPPQWVQEQIQDYHRLRGKTSTASTTGTGLSRSPSSLGSLHAERLVRNKVKENARSVGGRRVGETAQKGLSRFAREHQLRMAETSVLREPSNVDSAYSTEQQSCSVSSSKQVTGDQASARSQKVANTLHAHKVQAVGVKQSSWHIASEACSKRRTHFQVTSAHLLEGPCQQQAEASEQFPVLKVGTAACVEVSFGASNKEHTSSSAALKVAQDSAEEKSPALNPPKLILGQPARNAAGTNRNSAERQPSQMLSNAQTLKMGCHTDSHRADFPMQPCDQTSASSLPSKSQLHTRQPQDKGARSPQSSEEKLQQLRMSLGKKLEWRKVPDAAAEEAEPLRETVSGNEEIKARSYSMQQRLAQRHSITDESSIRTDPRNQDGKSPDEDSQNPEDSARPCNSGDGGTYDSLVELLIAAKLARKAPKNPCQPGEAVWMQDNAKTGAGLSEPVPCSSESGVSNEHASAAMNQLRLSQLNPGIQYSSRDPNNQAGAALIMETSMQKASVIADTTSQIKQEQLRLGNGSLAVCEPSSISLQTGSASSAFEGSARGQVSGMHNSQATFSTPDTLGLPEKISGPGITEDRWKARNLIGKLIPEIDAKPDRVQSSAIRGKLTDEDISKPEMPSKVQQGMGEAQAKSLSPPTRQTPNATASHKPQATSISNGESFQQNRTQAQSNGTDALRAALLRLRPTRMTEIAPNEARFPSQGRHSKQSENKHSPIRKQKRMATYHLVSAPLEQGKRLLLPSSSCASMTVSSLDNGTDRSEGCLASLGRADQEEQGHCREAALPANTSLPRQLQAGTSSAAAEIWTAEGANGSEPKPQARLQSAELGLPNSTEITAVLHESSPRTQCSNQCPDSSNSSSEIASQACSIVESCPDGETSGATAANIPETGNHVLQGEVANSRRGDAEGARSSLLEDSLDDSTDPECFLSHRASYKKARAATAAVEFGENSNAQQARDSTNAVGEQTPIQRQSVQAEDARNIQAENPAQQPDSAIRSKTNASPEIALHGAEALSSPGCKTPPLLQDTSSASTDLKAWRPPALCGLEQIDQAGSGAFVRDVDIQGDVEEDVSQIRTSFELATSCAELSATLPRMCPPKLLAGISWAVDQPISQATIDPIYASAESSGIPLSEAGNGLSSLSRAELEEVIFCGMSMTLLLPQDIQGDLGYHTHHVHVPKNGLTTAALLSFIADFYQGNKAYNGEASESRAKLLGSHVQLDSISRISRCRGGCIYEVHLTC